MKNKSKLNKIKNTNRQSGNQMFRNWFFMSDSEVSIDDIKSVWEEKYDVEIWREQEILEVSLGEKSIDLESCPTDFWDDESKQYLTENNVKTIFAVTISDTLYEESMEAFKCLINKVDGWFCADSENFLPKIGK